MLDNATMMQKDDILSQSASLANVVSHDDNFDAPVLCFDEKPLNSGRRGWIEARCGLIQEENVWLEAYSARQA